MITKYIKNVSLVLLFLFFTLTMKSFAAEVYYLGGDGSGESGTDNKSFPLEKRVKDLFDFGSYGKYGPDRSGRISGNTSVEVSGNNVYGNKDKSFIRKEHFLYGK